MGAYLSEPVTEKFSTDETNEYIDVGASSMQGWRISQEDAHNCILNFDENISFFAVYDGHGGAEVATYCAEKLPKFLKNLESYRSGKYEQALKDAFLKFDETLLQEDVLEILKQLAGERNPDREEEVEEEEEEEEDLTQLCQESRLPLDQVLEKYKSATAQFQNLNQIKEDVVSSNSGTLKISPTPSTCSTNVDEPCCSSVMFQKKSKQSKQNVESDDVSSSNVENEEMQTNTLSGIEEKVNKSPIIKENGGIVKCTSPDSSSVNYKNLSSPENVKNGEINSCGGSSSFGKNEGVSSTSSPSVGCSRTSRKQENGEMDMDKPCSFAQSIHAHLLSSCSSTSVVKNYHMRDGDSSSEEDDTDFHAEENSSTEDGEEDCEPCEDDSEEEHECEETEDEEGFLDDGFGANMIEEPGKDSGCTAVVALLHGRDLYVANAGDSRCVLCRGGEAIEMSLDHKPEDETEKTRIYKAGGKVTMDGRVNGGLNLSRAIGDHAYKMNKDLPSEEQMISALPDVKKIVITPEDEFMILACDGIWNYMSSEDVVQFIKTRLEEGRESVSKICEELFDNCLAPHTIGDGTGCDNMTAVIVRFKQSKILELPTQISNESDIEIATVTTKKRSMSEDYENDDDMENPNKRVKTDIQNQDDNKNMPTLSSSSSSSTSSNEEKCDSDSIDNEISTSSTTLVGTAKESKSQSEIEAESTASTTTQNENDISCPTTTTSTSKGENHKN